MAPTAVVVDDSSSTRCRLKAELARLGIAVVGEAATADTLIELYELHHPSLVLLDIILPGVGGVVAATELLKKYPSATVVMCSSLNARDKVLACRAAGVKHFILKPFSSTQIEEMAKKVLGLAPKASSRAVAS
jgi:two-component system chemotaxis response regulator CheY